MARSVLSEVEYGLCHLILFSSLVGDFGFEHEARAYASSPSSCLFVIWVKLVSDVGAYATMRMGNLFESSECFGRSFCWLAVFMVPLSLS